ncbi:MAG: alpha/beta hydrolase [Candidatus Omnitrophica bacterium]|nr:alpha/beta hydrolase [Candidatus Omnitrophota bacterium]
MLRVIIYIILGIVSLAIYVKYLEQRNLFFPFREINYTPQEIGLSYEDIYFATQDNKKINGWFIPSKNAKYAILFFHGNAGNISHRLDKIKIFHDLGLNIFIIDYRGYGNSEGKPSETGFYLDARASYGYLIDKLKIKPSSIILYGESLGGAVAFELATQVDVLAIITEETFSSVRDVAKDIYPFLPSFFVGDKFNSVSRIGKLTIPKLIVHSKDDEMIPFKHAQKLYESAKDPKMLVAISGSHNSAFLDSGKDYKNHIREFIEGLK